MKTTITKFLTGFLLLSALGSQAQCTLTTSVNAQPDSTGSLGYMITGNYSGGTNSYSYFYVSNGASFAYQDTLHYTFPAPGTYDVCFYVLDSLAGCSDTACTIVTAGDSTAAMTCNASFSYSNTSNSAYTFTGSASAYPSTYTSYQWDFGDNTTSGSNPASHTFAANGSYNVWLTTTTYNLSDSTIHCTSTYNAWVTVTNANGTTCSASLGSHFNGLGNYDFYTVSSTSYTSYQTFYQWTVDGNFITSNDSLNYTFTTNGNHNVCLSQWFINNGSADTCFASSCSQVSYYNTTSCNAYFIMWPDSNNNGVYYAYNNSTGGGNLTYLWDFGDGTTSTQAYPQHNYAVQGQYDICLTVTDSANNCTSTYCDSAGLFKTSSNGILGLTVLGTTLGVKDVEAELNINLFPNPVTESTALAITSDKSARMQMTVINVMGQVVLSEQLNVSSGKNLIPVNTVNLTGGIYFLTISNGNKMVKNIKLVK